MATDAICIFDLPELTQLIALHLPLGGLNKCVRVSKTWHATFIRHLWRTFNEETSLATPHSYWALAISRAIQGHQYHPEPDLEWYKDVYRRHAKYIRHLTFHQPVILDACLENAFRPSSSTSPTIPKDDDDKFTEESSTLGTATVAPTAARSIVVGQSLLTNLESLTINVTRQSLAIYFPEAFATAQNPSGTANEFGSTATFSFDNNINNEVTNDHEAKAMLTTPDEDPEQPFIDACQRLILSNPTLRTLKCVHHPKILQGLQSQPTGKKALLSLKNLSVASLDGRIPALLPPNVTNLTMTCVAGFLSSFPSNNDSSNPLDFVHEGLETLDVTNIKSASHLQTLLTQVPSLKTLSLGCMVLQYGFGSGLFGTPPPPPPTILWPPSCITVLKCHQSRGSFSQAHNFEGIFRAFPQLVEYHDNILCPVVATQLVHHCPLLEVVHIRQDPIQIDGLSLPYQPGFPPRMTPRRFGEQVQLNDIASVLLTSLPRLRVLDVPFEVVNAGRILEKPWVCLDLEELSCRLVEVPYLTKEQEERVHGIYHRDTDQQPRTDEEERLIELNERCISTRRLIMTQLSKMTSLKSLSLSPDLKIRNELFEQRTGATLVYKSERDGRSYIRYNDVLPDTPHFRLDSGFEQLASLKQLEYLGFESMDHRMDTAEIEWMAQQFPKLKEMRGLSTENYVGMEPDPKNDALVALMRRLRPDVIQGQSFGGYATIGTGFGFGFSAFGTSSGNLFR
ncbi:hypothetical protein BGZ95_002762 [Linnemannia exigua]|uniref:F-box domain-containing protein n=1 Tax=Linnemannia exigua TaxID=604196 RepID=A0AAD4DLW7_9FUNG|nr:hypothetical protein BGZ95_002762 [Linnemannia exigua]